ncbi:cellulose binding domain-containing protein [Spongiactinospora sp. 9N601]|uniref:cellulose binding domain-containing protein n=1 Tax=Spongiactinospora sp. 9N601 TaxID=3375149 RepID=UPI00379480C6
MRNTRTLISVAIAVLMAATSLLLTPGAAAAAAATATFTKAASWGSGFEGRFTITNGGTTPLNGWEIALDMPSGAAISSSWDTLMSKNGQRYVFKNVGWNGNLAPGATVNFGFIGTPGSAEPSNCTLNGNPCGDAQVPVPGKPGAPTVSGVTGDSISLSWSASSGTVTGYRVYEGTAVRATGSGTTATIGSLGSCETHTYTVKAYNSAGESPASEPVTGSTAGCTGGVPGKVGAVTASDVTSTSATLKWPAASGTVTGYRVYQGGTLKATVNTTTATVSGLTACATHSFTVRAYNDSGEGPASDPASVVTGGCDTGPLPKHFLTGYWHNFVNPAVEMKLGATPNEYDLIAVAFAEATSTPGRLDFKLDPALATAVGGYTEAEFKSDIAALHARGKKVILSVGGELGRVQVGSGQAATAFADSAYALMQEYGFDGVDIDLENGLNATYMAQALRQLHAKAGSDLIITMAPQTIDMQSTGMGYFQLALSIKDILTVVNMQYYNSGSMLGCDKNAAYSQGTVNFMTALACIQLENGLRPDQVALGLPAGAGAAGGGVVPPSMVNQALTCLARGTNCGSFVPPRTYPGIRGAMTWSINWDASHNWNFSKTVKPHLATLP